MCFPSASENGPSQLPVHGRGLSWVVQHITCSNARTLASSCLLSSGDHAHVSSLLTTHPCLRPLGSRQPRSCKPRRPNLQQVVWSLQQEQHTLALGNKICGHFSRNHTHTHTYKVPCHVWAPARPHTLHTENQLGFLWFVIPGCLPLASGLPQRFLPSRQCALCTWLSSYSNS